MDEVREMYAQSPVSVSAGTAHTPSNSAASRSELTNGPAHYPPPKNVSGSLFTCDANRIWENAPRMTEPEYRYRQRVPPCKADQAQIRKLFMSVRAHMLVRAYDVDIGEQIRGAERSYKASRSTRPLNNKT